MSAMAEVVEESLRLLTEVRSISREGLADHVAAELTKAGCGNMADAWDEGYQSGKGVMVALMSPTHFAEEIPNPYRGAGHE